MDWACIVINQKSPLYNIAAEELCALSHRTLRISNLFPLMDFLCRKCKVYDNLCHKKSLPYGKGCSSLQGQYCRRTDSLLAVKSSGGSYRRYNFTMQHPDRNYILCLDVDRYRRCAWSEPGWVTRTMCLVRAGIEWRDCHLRYTSNSTNEMADSGIHNDAKRCFSKYVFVKRFAWLLWAGSECLPQKRA